MGRGGYRSGAGRKSRYEAETTRIRVPISHKAVIEEIALRLDAGESLIVCPESELREIADGILRAIPPRDRASASRLLNKLIRSASSKLH